MLCAVGNMHNKIKLKNYTLTRGNVINKHKHTYTHSRISEFAAKNI